METVSLSQLATLAQVSKMTVSLALRNSPRISLPQRQRIREMAEKMGYRPDPERAHLMARLRSKAGRSYQGNLAFIYHPLIDVYCGKHLRERIHAQSALSGFACNEFLLDSGDTCKNMIRILKSRGIQGVILGTMWGVNLDQSFRALFEQFTCVAVGSIPKAPGLHAADADHYRAVRLAFGQALLNGYQRPGLIAEWETEIRREYRSSAAFMAEQNALPPDNRIPILWDAASEARKFSKWHETYRPDCLICDDKSMVHLLQRPSFEIPAKTAVISLDWRKDHPSHAGVDLRYEVVGAAAIDLLVQSLNMDDTGIPEHPRIVLVQPSWQPGVGLQHLSIAETQSSSKPVSARKALCFVSLPLERLANKSRNHFNANHDRSQVMRLIHFPSGQQTIRNVSYEIIDEEMNGGKSLVALHDMPDHLIKATPLSVTVPIHRRFKSAWFLHGCIWAKSMKHAASYRFIYADGSSVAVPIITLDEASPDTKHRRLGLHANIQDWWYTKKMVETGEVRPVIVQNPEAPDLYRRYLYTLQWINPYPHLEVTSLKLRGEGNGPTSIVIFAVTLEL